MKSTILNSGELHKYSAIGEDGVLVWRNAESFINALKNETSLGEDVTRILAIPRSSIGTNHIDWYVPFEPRKGQDEKRRALVTLEDIYAKIDVYADSLKNKISNSNDRLFYHFLKGSHSGEDLPALHYPDESCLFIVDGTPVITFWGFTLAGEFLEGAPFTRLRNNLYKDFTFNESSTVKNENVNSQAAGRVDSSKVEVIKNNKGCLLPLLWLLIALLALILLGFLFWKFLLPWILGLFAKDVHISPIPPKNEVVAEKTIDNKEDGVNLGLNNSSALGLEIPEIYIDKPLEQSLTKLPDLNSDGIIDLNDLGFIDLNHDGVVDDNDKALIDLNHDGLLDKKDLEKADTNLDGVINQEDLNTLSENAKGEDNGLTSDSPNGKEELPQGNQNLMENLGSDNEDVNEGNNPDVRATSLNGDNNNIKNPPVLGESAPLVSDENNLNNNEVNNPVDAPYVADNNRFLNTKPMSISKDDINSGAVEKLYGNWLVKSPLVSKNTGRPVNLSYSFNKDGKGKVVIKQHDGVNCVGDIKAVMQNGQLQINNLSQNAKCNNGSVYVLPNVSCEPGNGGQNKCKASYVDESGNEESFGIEIRH